MNRSRARASSSTASLLIAPCQTSPSFSALPTITASACSRIARRLSLRTPEPAITERSVAALTAAPRWDGPAVWMHGDLHPANLLVTDGQLSGVLDFGLLAVGDPAST